MIRVIASAVLIWYLVSCGSIMHQSHKIQSDARFRVTEEDNFASEKAITQWWYYDLFFDDGSVMVVFFVPHHWWLGKEDEPSSESILCVSFLDQFGELTSEYKVFDSKEVLYTENSVKSSYFEILNSHEKGIREYTLNFFLDKIRGSVKITSTAKAFSPLPRGSLSAFGAKVILAQKCKGYRYAAHVPQGDIVTDLMIGDNHIDLTGKSYHEQGWFQAEPHQMGDGWVWFHFVSENVNLFGATSFFYLEMNGEIIIGGLNTRKTRCEFVDGISDHHQPNLLIGGALTFTSSKTSFDVTSLGETSSSLICIPSEETDQLWGTTVQPSRIKIFHKGKEMVEEGRLLIETCRLSKVLTQTIAGQKTQENLQNRSN